MCAPGGSAQPIYVDKLWKIKYWSSMHARSCENFTQESI